MRFGNTAKVLLKCKLKYYRISERSSALSPDAMPITFLPRCIVTGSAHAEVHAFRSGDYQDIEKAQLTF